MTTVTQRIKEVKQPRGGYLPLNKFAITEYDDTFNLIDLSSENIPPTLVGTVVDYLTRLYLTGQNAEQAFDISLMGAFNLNLQSEAFELIDSIERNSKLSQDVIIDACKLASFDVAYRAGVQFYNPNSNTVPNDYTINAIVKMVERSLGFFENQGTMIYGGFTFDAEAYTSVISAGDGDFLTENALWDMKVSIKKPDSKQTLQILIYYIMGLHSPSHKTDFGKIETIGFFNPRRFEATIINVSDIDKEIINFVSESVIGY